MAVKQPDIHHCEVLKQILVHIFYHPDMHFQHWKASALCGWSDVVLLSCDLYVDSWLLQKHSLALNLAAL